MLQYGQSSRRSIVRNSIIIIIIIAGENELRYMFTIKNSNRLCGGGTGIEEEPCLVPCSIDCEMSDWNEWGVCSRLCGPGIHHRYRNVNFSNINFFFFTQNTQLALFINRSSETRRMAEDPVGKRYKRKFAILLVTVFSGLRTRGVNVNYRTKTN